VQEVTPEANVASNPANVGAATVPAGKVNQKQLSRLFALVHKDIPKEQVKLFLMHFYGVESSKDIPTGKYDQICELLSDKAKFDVLMGAIQ
jgi:hypothetical protein